MLGQVVEFKAVPMTSASNSLVNYLRKHHLRIASIFAFTTNASCKFVLPSQSKNCNYIGVSYLLHFHAS